MMDIEVAHSLRERDAAVTRHLTASVWSLRFKKLTHEYESAQRNAQQALGVAVDAIVELYRAAQAPVEIAPDYNRASRQLPFNFDLLLEDFVGALRRRCQ